MTKPLQEGQFRIGNVVYPLAVGDGYSALQTIDKVLYYLLDFMAGTLQANAGARWTYEVNQLKAQGLANNVSTTFVSPSRVAYNPVPYLKEAAFQFPLLAIYRTDNGSIREKSISAFVEFQQDLELLFILPPLKAEEMEHLSPFLNAAKDIIGQKNEHGYDPNWNNGEYIGPLANYEKIAAKTFSFEYIPTTTDLVMPTLIVGIRLWELNQPVDSTLEPVTGLDGYVTVEPDTGANIGNFIITNSDADPANFE